MEFHSLKFFNNQPNSVNKILADRNVIGVKFFNRNFFESGIIAVNNLDASCGFEIPLTYKEKFYAASGKWKAKNLKTYHSQFVKEVNIKWIIEFTEK